MITILPSFVLFRWMYDSAFLYTDYYICKQTDCCMSNFKSQGQKYIFIIAILTFFFSVMFSLLALDQMLIESQEDYIVAH